MEHTIIRLVKEGNFNRGKKTLFTVSADVKENIVYIGEADHPDCMIGAKF